jgi:uncharacterized protein with HEPN domain
MSDEIKKYLTDIIDSIGKIDIHLGGKKDFSHYSSNITIKRAIERELEIIGEAVGRILKLDSNFPISYGKIIVGMRNRIIHSYDAVDDNLLWKVIIKDIPVLKDEVETLLKK